jgi:hypothetical protein
LSLRHKIKASRGKMHAAARRWLVSPS